MIFRSNLRPLPNPPPLAREREQTGAFIHIVDRECPLSRLRGRDREGAYPRPALLP